MNNIRQLGSPIGKEVKRKRQPATPETRHSDDTSVVDTWNHARLIVLLQL